MIIHFDKFCLYKYSPQLLISLTLSIYSDADITMETPTKYYLKAARHKKRCVKQSIFLESVHFARMFAESGVFVALCAS